jgi:hypothetical protein
MALHTFRNLTDDIITFPSPPADSEWYAYRPREVRPRAEIVVSDEFLGKLQPDMQQRLADYCNPDRPNGQVLELVGAAEPATLGEPVGEPIPARRRGRPARVVS